MKCKLSVAALGAFVLVSATACAQVTPIEVVQGGEPVLNVDPARHGNIASAQEMVRDAYDRLSEAQSANHAQLGGHAGRAKELLREANEELKLAAIAANQRR